MRFMRPKRPEDHSQGGDSAPPRIFRISEDEWCMRFALATWPADKTTKRVELNELGDIKACYGAGIYGPTVRWSPNMRGGSFSYAANSIILPLEPDSQSVVSFKRDVA
ncbi:MAG TPA: hypothetical protein VJH24_02655, partial [Candidatus Bilamarchaeaceae archaeon]|nr:hypothetical protein [Candidatus Bilamarchaeaceae archaeon]